MDNKQSNRPVDTWARGAAYEPYVGRWSRVVAQEFLRWLAMPPNNRWAEVGCGTGALTQTILQIAEPAKITAIDRSAGFIVFAQSQIQDACVDFTVSDAQQSPIATAACDAAVSGLMLNFVPKPGKAIAEMARVVRPGGMVALYVWDYADKMQFLRYFWDAVVDLNPNDAEHDEGKRFPLCQPEPLTNLLQQAGLNQVKVRAIDIATHFKDFDDYWLPFLGGQGSAPSYVMSLNEEQRNGLREHIRATLPFAADGSISLIARAWAVRGVR